MPTRTINRIKSFLTVTVAVMACAVVMNFGTSSSVSAACSHNYYKTDICTKCGYENVHKTQYTLPFRTTNASTLGIHTGPRGSAKEYSIGKNTSLSVNGRIRNESSNLWLKLSNGRYIWADYTALDFDKLASQAVNEVKSNPYIKILQNFKSKAKYDLKCDNKLGCNTYNYKVYAKGTILSKKYTGEDLGNIFYGYVCCKSGISLGVTLKAPCLAETNCSDVKDNNNIKRGYTYAKTGKWTY